MINKKNLGGWAIGESTLKWIMDNYSEGSNILELGSGTGTIELCKYYNVTSVEHNKKYLNLSNSKYIYAPIKNYGKYEWYDKEIIIEKIKNLDYDLILVDGPPGTIGRDGFLHNINIFNTNKKIIIDDTQRDPEKKLAEDLSKILNKEKLLIVDGNKSFTVLF